MVIATKTKTPIRQNEYDTTLSTFIKVSLEK